jgi:hypothetical protein
MKLLKTVTDKVQVIKFFKIFSKKIKAMSVLSFIIENKSVKLA